MIRRVTLLISVIIISTGTVFGQSINIGFRLESYGYSAYNKPAQKHELTIVAFPLSAYTKAGILLYDKYEVELKGGFLLGDPFAGVEYSLLLKYNLVSKIFPFITYMSHKNFGDSRTGSGTSDTRINFWGAGIEAKLSKLFGVDLSFLFPVGDKKLGWTLDFSDGTYNTVTTEEMGPLVKLGFIFSFYL